MKRIVLLTALMALLFSVQANAKKDGPEIPSQWNGARVAFLGDSITDAGQLGFQDIYWHQLASILGIQPYCYGINGHQTEQVLGQARKMMEEHGRELDAVLIFIGTNDFNSSIPLGEWYREETLTVNRDGFPATLRHRVAVMDEPTVRSRINRFLSFLKHNYPTKQIILLTPIHRGYFNCYQYNVQPEESFANPLGLYIDDYVRVIKEAGDVWAVPVIDLGSICGLFPTDTAYKRYFRESDVERAHTAAEAAAAEPGSELALEYHDLLHPNTEGHRRMAYSIAYQLLGYPATF